VAVTDFSGTFAQLGIALGLGILVGLQRERAAARLAGIRTFPLVTLCGSLSALLAQTFGGWVLAAGFLAMGGTVLMGMRAELRTREHDPGLTTEVAILLMFALGAYVVVGERVVAIALGGIAAVLLQFKGQLHGWAGKLGDQDLQAIMKFVLIALVILPALPDRNMGPYSVLNPRQIWWMVVLIVGISLAGYIAYKFMSRGAGLVLAGLLGGLISSTATTVTYSRRARNSPETSAVSALVITVASATVFVRLLLIIAVASPAFLRHAAPPLALMLVIFVVTAGTAWWRQRSQSSPEVTLEQNPAELKVALLFGLLYAGVLFVVAAAKEKFGSAGLYVLAGISGLTDVDAITLSSVQLVNSSQLDPDTAWRVILLATLSNLVFKGGAVATLGSRPLFMRVLVIFSVALAAGIAALLAWPAR
jgi:uncharacterized membrane protein (DUF4010 family)